MRLNKKIAGTLILAILILSIGVGASYAASNNGNNGDNGNKCGNSADHRQDGAANGQEDTPKQLRVGNPHQFKQLKLMYTTTSPNEATEPFNWTHVAGNEVSGFKLCLSDTVEWYYIDVMALKPFAPVGEDMYGFIVDPTDYPTDFKGGLTDGSGDLVIQLLYDIFVQPDPELRVPIFYLLVSGDTYRLIDGFQYEMGERLGETDDVLNALRVEGSYPLGTYDYFGEVDGEDITMQITFRACECETCVEE